MQHSSGMLRVTWYVAKKLNWMDVADYKETVSSAHHAYPCTASMGRDTELGDTILYQAGYIIREAVEEGLVIGTGCMSS